MLALVLAGQGCLLPQDELVFPDLPAKQNSPLRVVASTPVDREVTFVVRTGDTPVGKECSPGFSLAVEDEDLRDTVQSQWFIDRGTRPLAVGSTAVFGMGSATRLIGAPAAVGNQLSTLNDGQVHLVEVFVTDGQFIDVGKAALPPYGSLPDGAVLQDTAYVDTWLWAVRVQLCL